MFESPRDTEFFLQKNSANKLVCGAHIHTAVELLYVCEGDYTVWLDGREHRIEEGDLILFSSRTIHQAVTNDCPQNSYYVIKLQPESFLELSTREASAKYVMRFAINRKGNKYLWKKHELENSPIRGVLEALIAENTRRGHAHRLLVKLKIMELLIEIMREDPAAVDYPSDHIAELIYDVTTYVHKHYAEDIDEKELAKNIGMSYSYFSRSFKRVTGVTFKSYLNRTRINKAEQLLCQKDMSISRVATECGYNSISYFISVYRSVTNKTPYSVMRSLRSAEVQDGLPLEEVVESDTMA